MGKFFSLRLRSFQHAFSGVGYIIRTQQNSWIHASFTFLVLLMAGWLQLEINQWAILILTITLVWIAELLNTAIEVMVDLVSPGFHPLAKISKDVAAGAVLFAALGSVIIGLLILGPPLWHRLVTIFH